MAAYAERGLAAMDQAVRLSEDYFVLEREAFLRRWMPGTGRRAPAPDDTGLLEGHRRGRWTIRSSRRSSRIIVKQTSVLVLAGPGSGKTRVLVHRIAYLIRVRREDPRGILVLTYNRHAAAEIRIRLRHLIGDEANAVTISTCHALAMRLVGASFAGAASETTHDFDGIVLEAVAPTERRRPQQARGRGATRNADPGLSLDSGGRVSGHRP